MPSKTQKGQEYERTVAKRLSLWASGMKRRDIFWRTPGSGARRTLMLRRKGITLAAHGGDIMATEKRGHWLTRHFFFECKFYKELGWAKLMRGVKANIRQWWEKTCKEAEEVGKHPVLVMKGNRTPDYLILDEWGAHHIRGYRRKRRRFDPIAVIHTDEPMYLFFFTDMLRNTHYGEKGKPKRRARL